MSRRDKELAEATEWRKLKRWLKDLQAKQGKLALKRDPVKARDRWEEERSLLQWALTKTAATGATGLHVKALALRAFSTCGGKISISEMRPFEIELAEQIIQGVLTLKPTR